VPGANGDAAGTPFGYAGEYADAESGLVYLRARSYDPATGQFLTRDPATGLTAAPYAYAGDCQ
jgi:RHS repeat-associated protein